MAQHGSYSHLSHLPPSWPQYPVHWTLSREAMRLIVHRHVERSLRDLSKRPIR